MVELKGKRLYYFTVGTDKRVMGGEACNKHGEM
jgi:hypothetical protein